MDNKLSRIGFICIAVAVIALILMALGVVVGLFFKLLPIILICLAVLFFVKGGRVHVEWSSSGNDRSEDNDNDDVIEIRDADIK